MKIFVCSFIKKICYTCHSSSYINTPRILFWQQVCLAVFIIFVFLSHNILALNIGVYILLKRFCWFSICGIFFENKKGYEIHTNDFLSFNHKIGESLVENKCFKLNAKDIEVLLNKNKNPKHFNLMRLLFTDIFFKEE